MSRASAEGKCCAIVTGAAGAIGAAVTRRLLADGMNVAAVDLQAEPLREMIKQLPGSGASKLPYVADVTDAAQVKATTEAIHATFGRIDVLVNIAGGTGPVMVREIELIQDEVWDHIIDLNLKSVFLCCRAVVPCMRERRYGRIVNLSSIAARGRKGALGAAGARLPYAAAKAGILGFTAQLAKDVAADGITVNALMPALILGEKGSRVRERFDNLAADARAAMIRDYPIGRAGEAREVAAAVSFLVSRDASFISGAALPVDGAVL